jgi:translation initiation factor 3 subunit L
VLEYQQSHILKSSYQRAEIPDAVKSFLLFFHRSVQDGAMFDLHSIYENTFNRLTEKYYAKQSWPDANLISPLVDNGGCFVTGAYMAFLCLDFARSSVPHVIP